MPPVLSKPARVPKSSTNSFFTPRSRRDVPVRDYNNIERNEVMPTNPPRAPTASAASSPTPSANEDTITVDTSIDNSDEDEEMPDVPDPSFKNTPMTNEEKMEAIKKWKTHRQKHERKRRDKASHVYSYMRMQVLPGILYPEVKGGPKILQEYKWTCKLCEQEPAKLRKQFTVLESHRQGVTTGMGDHLKTHGITRDTHFARLHGYTKVASGGSYPELNWSGQSLIQARLTSRQASRRWFIKSRQPFSEVEAVEFQEMFLSLGVTCPYRSRLTLRNHIFDDFILRREGLKQELKINCISISFTLDMWTAPNRTPIFAIIGHWITPDFEEREEVLEFVEVKGSHTGEALAVVVEKLLEELALKQKLFAITGDNAGNNGTLCEALHKSLKQHFDDKLSPIGKPQMRFHGRDSWIRCFAHVIALICGDVLDDLKAGTAKQAKKWLDDWDKKFNGSNYDIPMDESRSSIAKIRLLNLWILRSPYREQDWKGMPKTLSRRPIYDVDSRWNAMFDMIQQFIDLLPEYTAFINSHPQVKCLLPTPEEQIALHQIAFVLRPFKDMTLQVSETMPSLVRSLEKYWDLDDLLEQVTTGTGIYSELDQSLRTAFGNGQKKYVKYAKKLKSNSMIYAAHILDPRCKALMIKDMMPDQFEEVLDTTREFFKTEWPQLAQQDTPSSSNTTLEAPETRPFGMSLAQWKAIQNKKAKDAEANMALPTSELERWLASEPLDWDPLTNNDPGFIRKWWKEHANQWPLLEFAARDLLPCSASEVDVERLFSGCKDEYGIRRHALKAETVRVLTLLRSAYKSEDAADNELLKDAMKLDVMEFRNSIIWKPDQIGERLPEPGGECSIPIHESITSTNWLLIQDTMNLLLLGLLCLPLGQQLLRQYLQFQHLVLCECDHYCLPFAGENRGYIKHNLSINSSHF
jgi:hAT family C-terminal dimerisation region